MRSFDSDPPNNSTYGTLDIRRTFKNESGGNLTGVRFRILSLSTFPASAGTADLRPRSSTAVIVTRNNQNGAGTENVTVQGTTLDQPPSQPNGGGFNSSLSLSSVSLDKPLAANATVDTATPKTSARPSSAR